MGRSRTPVVVGVVALALLGVGAIGARAVLPPGSSSTPTPATLGPLISGTSSYVDGTYVWTDYAYDDRGPDTDGTAGGDAAYPADMHPNNVADLVQLQVSIADAAHTHVRAVLETLTDATRPVLGIAFDRDGNPATGAPSLPGSWVARTPLGVDTLFVLTRAGGTAMTWDGGKWAARGSFPVALDGAANTVTADVPFAMPASGVVRAAAAIGYDDGAGHSWVTTSSPVQDLAFVVAESPTRPYLDSVVGEVDGFAAGGERNWQDYRQSAVLGGHADAAPAVASIDAGLLRSHRTSLATANAKGFHTFLYESALRLGEGVAGSGNSAVYNGPYQPYLVWVPGGMRPGLPLVLYLHGASQTHLSGVNTAQYDPSTRNETLGLPDAIFDFPAVVAWPLGRGPETWYRGAALQDPLDVADDVIARLGIDRERVMLAGLSMGGYGTFKLGELVPDRWSIAYVDVGADDTMLPENFTSLPVRFQNGVADPLIPLSELSAGRDPTPQRTRSLFESAGTVDYRSWVVAKETHQPAVALAECVYRYSFEHPRVVNPPRVRYTADRSTWLSDAASGLSRRFDRAYWVSGIDPVSSGSDAGRGSVDVTSFAFGAVPVPGPSFSGVQENVTSGRDFCGPNPAVQTRDVWSETGRVVASAPHAIERRLAGTLRGLAAVTLAMDRAGLGGRAPWTASLSSDHAVSLTLTGLVPGTRVSVGGAVPSTVRSNGTVVVALAPGANQLTGG
jgi:hypothetical protein